MREREIEMAVQLKSQFLSVDQQLQDALKQGLSISEVWTRFDYCNSTVPFPSTLLSQETRLRIYGLAKHAKEGDCKMPMPPRF